MGGLLESYSFERVLERGFVVVRDENGDPVTSAKKTKTGDAIALQFADGEANAVIAGSGSKPRPKTKPEPVIHQQGKLL